MCQNLTFEFVGTSLAVCVILVCAKQRVQVTVISEESIQQLP